MNMPRNILARSVSFAAAFAAMACFFAVAAHSLTPSGTKISTSSVATYSDGTGKGMPAAASNIVVVTVAQVAGDQVSPPTRIAEALPGACGYVPVTIQNVGNGTDAFGLTVTGSSSWSQKLVADSNNDGVHQSTETTAVTSTPSVAAGGSYRCFLAVTVPSGTTGSGTFTLSATSSFDATKKANETCIVTTAVSGTPSLVEAGEPIVVSIGLSSSAAKSVTANGVPLTAGVGSWTGKVPASPVVGSHNVDIAVTDTSGNVGHDTSVTYTTGRVVASNGKWMNNPTATSCRGNCIFEVYGKASQVTANSFVVSDGSPYPITVNASGHSIHANDFIKARGILQTASGLILQSTAAKVSKLD